MRGRNWPPQLRQADDQRSLALRARGDGACQRWPDNGDRIAHARKRVAVSAGFETACCKAVQLASRLFAYGIVDCQDSKAVGIVFVVRQPPKVPRSGLAATMLNSAIPSCLRTTDRLRSQWPQHVRLRYLAFRALPVHSLRLVPISYVRHAP
jgi:hypothetical protein